MYAIRSYYALPKSERIPVPVNAEKGKLLFVLSPNDLVYVPTQSELENPTSVDFGNLNKEQVGRIMKVNDFSGVTCYFTPNTLSIAIAPKEIDSSFDNKTAVITSYSIHYTKLYEYISSFFACFIIENSIIFQTYSYPHIICNGSYNFV